MHINRPTIKKFHQEAFSIEKEISSEFASLPLTQNMSVHTEVIPITTRGICFSEKPMSMIVQDQPNLSGNDIYFSSYQNQGYLNIKDSHTFQTKNLAKTRYAVSLHKTRQISQYIIPNSAKQKTMIQEQQNQESKCSSSIDNKTFSHCQHRKSKSVIENYAITRNMCHTYKIDSLVNRNTHQRKNIGLTLKLLYQKKHSMTINLTITRAIRTDKGGVVDLALPDLEKTASRIKYTSNNFNYSPKKREWAAIIIQKWWKRILEVYKRVDTEIVFIQCTYRGYIYRKKHIHRPVASKIQDKKKMINQYGLFALYIKQIIKSRMESMKHSFLNRMLRLKKNTIEPPKYREGLQKIVDVCYNMHIKSIIKAYKLKIFEKFLERCETWSTNSILRQNIRQWKKNTLKPESLKRNKMRKVLINKTINDEKYTVLLYFKSLIRWKHKLNHIPQRKIIINKKTQIEQNEEDEEEKPQIKNQVNTKTQIKEDKDDKPYFNNQINTKPNLIDIKIRKNKLLGRTLSSTDMKNALNKKIYLLKWVVKSKTKAKRQIIKSNTVIKHIIIKHLCFDIIDKIRKESNRRKLIRMFLHVRNRQIPTLGYTLQRLIIFSNIKYQILNAYASVIQSYYRMRKSRKTIYVFKVTKTTTVKRNKQTIQNNSSSSSSTKRIKGNATHVSSENNEENKYSFRNQSSQHLIRRNNYTLKEFLYYASRRYFIKGIVETLMLA